MDSNMPLHKDSQQSQLFHPKKPCPLSISFDKSSLSPAYLKFLQDNNIDADIYSQATSIPRYIRINPRNPISQLNLELQFRTIVAEGNIDKYMPNWKNQTEKELFKNILLEWGLPIVKSTSIPTVYCLPNLLPIKYTDAYAQKQIYGIDLSSILAVACLNVQQGDHVLDMCCAPGAKLTLLADSTKLPYSPLWSSFHTPDEFDKNKDILLLPTDELKQKLEESQELQEQQESNINTSDVLKQDNKITTQPIDYIPGTVTGVDIELNRMNSCKALLTKYGIDNVRLYATDGCTFNIEAPRYHGIKDIFPNKHQASQYKFIRACFPPAWCQGFHSSITNPTSAPTFTPKKFSMQDVTQEISRIAKIRDMSEESKYRQEVAQINTEVNLVKRIGENPRCTLMHNSESLNVERHEDKNTHNVMENELETNSKNSLKRPRYTLLQKTVHAPVHPLTQPTNAATTHLFSASPASLTAHGGSDAQNMTESKVLSGYDWESPLLPPSLSEYIAQPIFSSKTRTSSGVDSTIDYTLVQSSQERLQNKQYNSRILKESSPLWRGPLKTGFLVDISKLNITQETQHSNLHGRYNRVIVDAECTHDGSLKHILKFGSSPKEYTTRSSTESTMTTKPDQNSNNINSDDLGLNSNDIDSITSDYFEKRFFDDSRLESLPVLQRRLLFAGFQSLQEGGELVYSTCSLSRRQNEDVAAWLLRWTHNCEIIPVTLPSNVQFSCISTTKEPSSLEDEHIINHISDASIGAPDDKKKFISYRQAFGKPGRTSIERYVSTSIYQQYQKQALTSISAHEISQMIIRDDDPEYVMISNRNASLDSHVQIHRPGKSWEESYNLVQRHALRFDTSTNTSGLFVAKFLKTKCKE